MGALDGAQCSGIDYGDVVFEIEEAEDVTVTGRRAKTTAA